MNTLLKVREVWILRGICYWVNNITPFFFFQSEEHTENVRYFIQVHGKQIETPGKKIKMDDGNFQVSHLCWCEFIKFWVIESFKQDYAYFRWIGMELWTETDFVISATWFLAPQLLLSLTMWGKFILENWKS